MKYNSILAISISLISLLIITSCDKDDNGPAYNFKDQILQGSIEGKTFVMKDGYFEESFFDETEYSIEIHDENEPEDACAVFSSEFPQVFFSVPKAVGLYKLKFDLANFSGRTVTLYDPDGSINNIAVAGAIEVLSISETTLTGRLDARMNKDNIVNGNFTVILCPAP